MKVTKPLPSPSADEIQHSDQLSRRICDEINANQGSISFRKYMEMALYEPALGYYVAGKRKLGEGGDFVTAPEISALFSRCIANQCAQVLQEINTGSILEFGAGSGIMAADILLHLEKLACLPEHYYIIDLSPELKQQQRNTLERHAAHLLSRVEWLSTLPEKFSGVILGNEVLDAMPAELFHYADKQIFQQHVIFEDDQFKLINKVADDSFLNSLHFLNSPEQVNALNLPDNYTSEFNPNINHWIEQLTASLQQGIILLIDYGYSRQEYYHPDRDMGTLICHYHHLTHNNFFWYPGLQDITANVDFTHVAEAADNKGLLVAGFTSQAAFLAACGLEDLFIQALEQSPEQQYHLAQQIRTLSLPAEMGERFKVIALNKKMDIDLIGFSTIDYRHKL
jgi:SAM-dependent MidA family methyltransferase